MARSTTAKRRRYAAASPPPSTTARSTATRSASAGASAAVAPAVERALDRARLSRALRHPERAERARELVRLAGRRGGGVRVERVRAERVDGVLQRRHALERAGSRVAPERRDGGLQALVRRICHAA